MPTTLIETPGSSFKDVINNSPYRFNIGLFSSDGRYQEVNIGAVNSLVLEDDFTDFYHKGYIILRNEFDAVERVADSTNKETLAKTSVFTPNKGFIFKGDSRDMIIIDIMPKLDDSESTYASNTKGNEPFRLLFNFSIYNTEEISGAKPGEKYKKLYFWDIYYELLREKNSYFSTANYLNSKNVNDLSNSDRAILTGKAIKSFLKEFFDANDGYPVNISDDEFDEGSTTVFFSSPAEFKGIDSLEYLMSRHVSNKNDNFDQGFLRLERNSLKFTLQSLGNIFKSALNNFTQSGTRYLETFKLGLYADNSGDYILENITFTPTNGIFLGKYGIVNNFSFDPMPGQITQSELVTHVVHSYDYDEKSFNIDKERNTINSALSVYNQNYVLPFNKMSYDGAYSNFFPGEYRLQQKNIKNVFTIVQKEADQRLSTGRNKALFSNIFLNNTILFRVPGSTHRQAGRFIGVNREGAQPYSDFDSKLLGVYFVTEVKHVFEGNEYFNELRCVKTYSFDNLFLNTKSK